MSGSVYAYAAMLLDSDSVFDITQIAWALP
jgi:hypothetical protein